MSTAKALSRLLYVLYSASTNPELWTRCLEDLTKLFDVGGAAILYQDLKEHKYNFGTIVGRDPKVAELYEAYYGKIDEYRDRFLARKQNELSLGDELCPIDYLRKTEFYNDLLLKFDVRLWCAVPTLKTATRLELISLYSRGWKHDLPGRRSIDLVEMLIPHLQSALYTRRIFSEAQQQKNEMAEALNFVDVGIILVDGTGACLFVNKPAEQTLASRDGLMIRNCKLCVSQSNESAHLQFLIQQAALIGAGKKALISRERGLLVSRARGSPLHLAVSPFVGREQTRGHIASPRTVAIVIVCDPDRKPAQAGALLKTLYKLTPAESRLVELLMMGNSLTEAAEMNGVTRETVRSQLKAIFAKTRTPRQSELMRLLSALPIWNKPYKLG